jgi:membrane protein DedA with SNARE-associated domain
MEELLVILSQWLLQYGAPVLFCLLLLGIVGLPIPDESLLILSGWLLANNKLLFIPTILAAILGSIGGISLSYLFGRYAGSRLLRKYGPKMKISPEKLDSIHNWYEHIGKWLLFVGYFIPVVRHLSGFFAGSTKLSYRQFALFAYSGAIIWSTTFIAVGYYLIIELKRLPKM